LTTAHCATANCPVEVRLLPLQLINECPANRRGFFIKIAEALIFYAFYSLEFDCK